MDQHRFDKSEPYNAVKGCPSGYHKRSEYTTAAGTYVPPRCVRSTSPYAESSKDFKRRTLRKMKTRMEGIHKKKGEVHCPPGYVSRASYARRYSTAVRQRGYTVRKASGTTYKVYPKNEILFVPASCIKDTGLPGKGVPEPIGPLRKGEMTKFGYSSKRSTEERHAALKLAVAQLGALSTYRKLDAVAKLGVRVSPDSARIFAADRDWVAKTFGPLKAF